MGRRRKERLLDVLIRLPWWMGFVGALIVLAARPIALPWVAGNAGMLKPVIPQFSFFFYLFAFLFAVGALASFIRQWWTGRKLDRQTGSGSIQELSWRDQERVLLLEVSVVISDRWGVEKSDGWIKQWM